MEFTRINTDGIINTSMLLLQQVFVMILPQIIFVSLWLRETHTSHLDRGWEAFLETWEAQKALSARGFQALLMGWEQRRAWSAGACAGGQGLTTLLWHHRSPRPYKSHFIEENKETGRGEGRSVPGPRLEPDPLTSQCLVSLVNPSVLWSLNAQG